MLGFVRASERGEADAVLARCAEMLALSGVALAGVVQRNLEVDPDRPCHMDLHVLGNDRVIRISQTLGALSQGCRLNTAALEEAVGLTEAALACLVAGAPGPRLVILNKFGKQEAEGRGFRPLIAQAMAGGVPVLTSVNSANLSAFHDFADGLAEALPPDPALILHWVQQQTKELI